MLAFGKAKTTAHGKYVVRTLVFMAIYVALNVAAIFGIFDALHGQPGAWLLALAVSAPVAGQMWATLSLMNEADEFLRSLTAKQFIVSSGIAMALFSTWGFAESYADAPHVPGWVIYPIFWGVFGCVAPFIKTSR